MKCIVCAKELKNLFEEGYQPDDAVAFHTHGHYGSTVFDPMDGTSLLISICDPCLIAAGADGKVTMAFPRPAAPMGPTVRWPMTVVEDESALSAGKRGE